MPVLDEKRITIFFLLISSLLYSAVISAAQCNDDKSDKLCLYAYSGTASQSQTPMLDFVASQAKNPFKNGPSFDDSWGYEAQEQKALYLQATKTTSQAEIQRRVATIIALTKNNNLEGLFKSKEQLLHGNQQIPLEKRNDRYSRDYQSMTLSFLREDHAFWLQNREQLLREANIPSTIKTLTSEHERHVSELWLGKFYATERYCIEIACIMAVREQGIQYIDSRIKQSVPQLPQESRIVPQALAHTQPAEQVQTISKDYSVGDNKSLTLYGSTEQHEIYQEAYTLLREASAMRSKAKDIPEANLYIESSESLSLSAIEVAQSGHLEIAADYADMAQMLLQHAEYIIEKSALVTLGAARGGAKGILSLVTAPLDCVRMGYRLCSLIGKTASDVLYNLATDPKAALNGYVESMQSLGRLTLDRDSAERKTLHGKIEAFLEKVGSQFDTFADLPLEDQVEFLTEFAVPILLTPQQLATKVPALDRVRKAVTKIIKSEKAALQSLAQTTRAQVVEYQGIKTSAEIVKEIGKIEQTLGKKLQGRELLSEVRKIEQKIIASNAPLLTNALQEARREKILPKVSTYEQAKNKALEIIGEVDFNTSKPCVGRLGLGEGQIVGRRWHGIKVTMRLDYDLIKGPHINVTDFRDGKNLSFAIPFEGDRESVTALLKHLQR